MTTFADRLISKMNEKRLTQSQLARRLNVTPTAVWNWENGNSTPRRKSLEKLAKVLSVEVDWLLEGVVETESAEAMDSLEDEIERLQVKIAELNGIAADRVRIQILIA